MSGVVGSDPDDPDDRAMHVTVGTDGNVYWAYPISNPKHPMVLKTDRDLIPLWSRTVSGVVIPNALVPYDDGVLVANDVCIFCPAFPFGPCGDESILQMRVHALGNDGTLRWTLSYVDPDGPHTVALALQEGPNGSFFVAGAAGWKVANVRAWVAQFDSNRNLLWSRTYPGYSWQQDPELCSHYEAAAGLALSDSGTLVVCGLWDNRGFLDNSMDAWITKLDVSPAVPAPPAPPTNLTGADSCGGILLSWQLSVSTTVTGYQVYRATAAGVTKSLVTSLGSTASIYLDTNMTSGRTYWFEVTAMAGSVASMPGNEANVFHASCGPSLSEPATPSSDQVWIGSTTGRLPFFPSRGEALTIRVNPTQSGPARVVVYSLLWEEVFRVYDGVMSPGPIEVRWDGRNLRGDFVAAGMYLVKLELPGKNPVIKRIVLGR